MNVLILDQFSEPGGAQLCLFDVLDEMRRRNWRARLLAPGNGPLIDRCRSLGYPTGDLPLGNYANGRKTFTDVARFGFDSARCALAVRAAIAAESPDLLYINGPRALTATLGLKTPLVFHAHSLLNRNYTRGIADACLGNAQVIAIASYVAQAFTSSTIIYNGVADPGFQPKEPRPGPLHVGMLGRIAPEKGQLDFVRAARLLVEQRPGMRFSITGRAMFSNSDYETQVRREAEGLPVEFADWTENIGELLHSLDLLAVPSGAIEATPRVIMEALAAGTPVVAYPSGGIPELIRHGDTGMLTTASAPTALAGEIAHIATTPELLGALATRGRQEWEQRFRRERFQQDVCNFLEAQVSQRAADRTSPAPAAR